MGSKRPNVERFSATMLKMENLEKKISTYMLNFQHSMDFSTYVPPAHEDGSTQKCRFMGKEVRENRAIFCCAAARV